MQVRKGVYLPNNAGVASEGLANLVANALVRLDTVDGRGLIINAGRSTRLATDGQIRSLLAMWGGQSAMPGCRPIGLGPRAAKLGIKPLVRCT